MRKKHAGGADEAEIDMTPMLDIVFIMLIFFIVTTSFVKEAGIDIQRPSGKSAAQSTKKSQVVLITVNSQNEIVMDGRSVDIRLVRSNVEKVLAESPDASVMVQAHKDAATDTLIAVVNATKEAGIAKASVATYDKDS